MKVRRDPLDALFSKFIRLRDKLTCQRCGHVFPELTQGLHCAHYHKRRNQSVRFDPDNCVAFCWGCHQYMDEHHDEHKAFMKRRLGEERFNFLEGRMRQFGGPDRKALRIWLNIELAKIAQGGDIDGSATDGRTES